MDYKGGTLLIQFALNNKGARSSSSRTSSGPTRRDRDRDRDRERDRGRFQPYQRGSRADAQMEYRPMRSGVNNMIQSLATQIQQQAHEELPPYPPNDYRPAPFPPPPGAVIRDGPLYPPDYYDVPPYPYYGDPRDIPPPGYPYGPPPGGMYPGRPGTYPPPQFIEDDPYGQFPPDMAIPPHIHPGGPPMLDPRGMPPQHMPPIRDSFPDMQGRPFQPVVPTDRRNEEQRRNN